MAKLTERYSAATRSSNLKPKREQHEVGDLDILGAYGKADKHLTDGRDGKGNPVRPAPLAVPLERLLTGDNNSAYEIVRLLAVMVFERSWEVRVKIGHPQCHDMAKACLAWFRNGSCRPCGGHGKTLIPGSPAFSGHDCPACRGTGKIPFESQFRQEHQALARWLVIEMEAEVGRAAPAAMRALSSGMDL